MHMVTAVSRIQLQELKARILSYEAALVLLKHENIAQKVCEHELCKEQRNATATEIIS